MMEKGPMHGILEKQKIVRTSNTLRGMGSEVIVKKFSNNVLDNTRRERTPT